MAYFCDLPGNGWKSHFMQFRLEMDEARSIANTLQRGSSIPLRLRAETRNGSQWLKLTNRAYNLEVSLFLKD